jgi:hypothetical protein
MLMRLATGIYLGVDKAHELKVDTSRGESLEIKVLI